MDELSARTKLSAIVSEKPFIRGSLSKRKLTCGNPTCQCMTKGKLHVAHYLGVLYNKKRQTIHVPADWVPSIQQWLANYDAIAEYLGTISESSITKLVKSKTKVAKAD
jgi:hypothetical protein